MCSPDWEKEHEASGNVYLYQSERMARLENISWDGVLELTDIEARVKELREVKRICLFSAILSAVYDIFEQQSK